MKLKFYGVRGSVPTPGINTVKYGGNTVCLTLQSSQGNRIIFDCGTGLKVLGEELKSCNEPIYILLTHNHWDHIQGFPFFIPAYKPNQQITIIAGQTELYEHDAILRQMDGSYFPVSANELSADIKVFRQRQPHWQYKEFIISSLNLNHPGGGSAYKVEVDGKVIIYATDNELNPPNSPTTTFQQWINFVSSADILIHDGQFIAEDLPHKHGWGHSLIGQALELAKSSKVKKLVITSHDPCRTDQDIDTLATEIDKKNYPFETIFAFEGLEIS